MLDTAIVKHEFKVINDTLLKQKTNCKLQLRLYYNNYYRKTIPLEEIYNDETQEIEYVFPFSLLGDITPTIEYLTSNNLCLIKTTAVGYVFFQLTKSAMIEMLSEVS